MLFRRSKTPFTDDRVNDAHLPWNTGTEYGGWVGSERLDIADSTSSQTPVLFVHGNGKNADDWVPHVTDFTSRGTYAPSDLFAITFRNPCSTHTEMAAQLDMFVDQMRAHTGSETINIVAHSLGVTGVRYWLQNYNRDAWVDTFVGLAGANHGIPPLKYAKLDRLDDPDRTVSKNLMTPARNPEGVVAKLNEDGETPCDVTYYTIRGRFDRYFVGNNRSPCLDGAQENILLYTTHDGVRTNTRAKRRLHSLLSE